MVFITLKIFFCFRQFDCIHLIVCLDACFVNVSCESKGKRINLYNIKATLEIKNILHLYRMYKQLFVESITALRVAQHISYDLKRKCSFRGASARRASAFQLV